MLAANLSEIGLKADALHGDMRQFLRRKVLDKFRSGQINILIATDVAARALIFRQSVMLSIMICPKIRMLIRTGSDEQVALVKRALAISFCNDSDALKLRQILSAHGDDIDLCDADGNPVSDQAISS